MNSNNSKTAEIAKGKVFARAVFFMAQNPDTDRWEPMAYFPDIPWDIDGRNMTSYMHDGQHGPCADSFIFTDCKAPSKGDRAAVERLKAELRGIGYMLTELDARKWLAEHSDRAEEVRDAIYQICFKKDSEAMLAANAANGEMRRKTA